MLQISNFSSQSGTSDCLRWAVVAQGFKLKALPCLNKESLLPAVTHSHKAQTDDFCVSVK